MDQQMAPENDQVTADRRPDLDGAATAADPQSPAPAVSIDASASIVADPVFAAGADAAGPSFVSAAAAEPRPVRESPLPSGSASPAARWHEIQAMFVDDPRASVELAAGLVSNSVEALVVSVRQRQRSLLSAWQGDEAGTEELRTTLQRYRAFWNRLEDFPGES